MRIQILMILGLFYSCNSPQDRQIRTTEIILPNTAAKSSSFNFERPAARHVLPKKLREISSLSYDIKSNTFFTNNDENGIIYELEKKDFSIKNEIAFSDKGDYEGLEKIAHIIYIVKSSGKITSLNALTKETKKYNNVLSNNNNVEGLCYHAEKNLLLLACKGKPLEKDKSKETTKAVYSIDLSTMHLNTDPFILLSISDLINSYSEQNSNSESLKKAMKRLTEFSPSGIAIHPLTKEYYLLSAKGSSLAILDQKKTVKSVILLDKKTIPQPEGITFDELGQLYIATEGQGSAGKIFKFNYEN